MVADHLSSLNSPEPVADTSVSLESTSSSLPPLAVHDAPKSQAHSLAGPLPGQVVVAGRPPLSGRRLARLSAATSGGSEIGFGVGFDNTDSAAGSISFSNPLHVASNRALPVPPPTSLPAESQDALPATAPPASESTTTSPPPTISVESSSAAQPTLSSTAASSPTEFIPSASKFRLSAGELLAKDGSVSAKLAARAASRRNLVVATGNGGVTPSDTAASATVAETLNPSNPSVATTGFESTPAPSAAPPELPRGWTTHISSSGKTFYYNRELKIKTNTRPAAETPN